MYAARQPWYSLVPYVIMVSHREPWYASRTMLPAPKSMVPAPKTMVPASSDADHSEVSTPAIEKGKTVLHEPDTDQ